MNVFLVIGNILNLVYNVPQIVKTYKSKSTKDFSSTFLFMRVVSNSIWLAYSIELNTFLFLMCNVVSVASSVFISYYKVVEMYSNYNKDKAIEMTYDAASEAGVGASASEAGAGASANEVVGASASASEAGAGASANKVANKVANEAADENTSMREIYIGSDVYEFEIGEESTLLDNIG